MLLHLNTTLKTFWVKGDLLYLKKIFTHENYFVLSSLISHHCWFLHYHEETGFEFGLENFEYAAPVADESFSHHIKLWHSEPSMAEMTNRNNDLTRTLDDAAVT